jgi:hypothetical protein
VGLVCGGEILRAPYVHAHMGERNFSLVVDYRSGHKPPVREPATVQAQQCLGAAFADCGLMPFDPTLCEGEGIAGRVEAKGEEVLRRAAMHFLRGPVSPPPKPNAFCDGPCASVASVCEIGCLQKVRTPGGRRYLTKAAATDLIDNLVADGEWLQVESWASIEFARRARIGGARRRPAAIASLLHRRAGVPCPAVCVQCLVCLWLACLQSHSPARTRPSSTGTGRKWAIEMEMRSVMQPRSGRYRPTARAPSATPIKSTVGLRSLDSPSALAAHLCNSSAAPLRREVPSSTQSSLAGCLCRDRVTSLQSCFIGIKLKRHSSGTESASSLQGHCETALTRATLGSTTSFGALMTLPPVEAR